MAFVALFLLSGIIAAPFIMNQEDRSMTADARRALETEGYQFRELSLGSTHYELTGPEDGHLVVLVHGTSGPMTVWDAMVGPLTEAGFRVLRFDFYGRGYSERVDNEYKLELFVGQLDELLTSLNITKPVTLVGSSLGGIVSAEMALLHARRIRSVVFIGPAGFALEASPLADLAQVRWLGDYLMKVLGDRKLVEHHRKYFVEADRFDSYHDDFARMLRYRGTKAAILSTLRHTPLQSYAKRYRRFGDAMVPSLLVWGTADVTFPFENHTTFLEAVPHAQFAAVEAAAHLPMLEKPARTSTAIIEFVSGL